MDHLSDERLIASASAGDLAAFMELVARYQGRIFGLAQRIVGNRQDAEDVTQQTFVSLLEHMTRFRGESSAASWILRIATNHALKVLRKRRGLPTANWVEADGEDGYGSVPHPDFIAHWSETPETLVEQAEVRDMIDKALSSLDDKYRVIFVLRDVEGLSIRETAELLELTESTVKIRLLRARLMLREKLTQTFGDESTRLIADHRHDENRTSSETRGG